MTDRPIAWTADGRPVYDNASTVVIMLIRRDGALLAIRRANQPGYGKIGLPGGHHMRGETWQQAGARETAEETGYVIEPGSIRQVGETVTDESGFNLVFASYAGPIRHAPSVQKESETLETLWLAETGDEAEWAFPRHHSAAMAEFAMEERLRPED